MADVSLDDLIKKDKEQFKANRANKVAIFLSRNSINQNLKKDFKTIISNKEVIDNRIPKMNLVISRKNLLKNLITIRIILDRIDNKKEIDKRIDLQGNKDLKDKKMMIKKNYSEH